MNTAKDQPPHNPARIVVFTLQGSHYGLRFLNWLHRNGLRPDAIVVRKNDLNRQLKLLRSVARRIGYWDTLWAALKVLEIQKRVHPSGLWRGEPLMDDYSIFCEKIVLVSNFHSDESMSFLKSIHPHYIFLAHSDIIKNPVIEQARLGVLNAHPGRLPQYRGVDIPWWTLYEGKPEHLGCTLHFIDQGVDTGPIVKMRAFQDSTKPAFDLLEERLYEDCIDLLTEAFHDIRAGKDLPRLIQEKQQGRQYYKMRQSDRKVARQSYDRWTLPVVDDGVSHL